MNRVSSWLLHLLFCALLLTLTSSPAWAMTRPENRVGEIFSAPLKSALADLAKPIGTPSENPGCGYDFASGVRIYLYGADNPVNMVDPSGEDGDIISLNVSMNLVAGLAAFTAASVYEAKTHAIGNLMVAAWNETMTDTASATAAAESALSVARTSTRQLIKEAEDVLKQTGQALKKVKVIPVPRSVIPNVANHVAMAQASGKPMMLTRTTPAQALLNRAAATKLSPPGGPGTSLDEYPFASSVQGGFGASVVPVPWLENSIQGGIIGACYTIEGITPGTPYFVVVTP